MFQVVAVARSRRDLESCAVWIRVGRYLGEPELAHTARTPRRSVHVRRVAPATTLGVMPGG